MLAQLTLGLLVIGDYVVLAHVDRGLVQLHHCVFNLLHRHKFISKDDECVYEYLFGKPERTCLSIAILEHETNLYVCSYPYILALPRYEQRP